MAEPSSLFVRTGRAGSSVAEHAAWRYPSPLPDGPPIKGYLAFYWHQMDAWYEEVAKVNAPVLAFYGSRDPSVPLEQVRKIQHMYEEAGKDITVKAFDAGHAFLNPDHGMGNEKAAAEAWPLAVNFLKQHLK